MNNVFEAEGTRTPCLENLNESPIPWLFYNFAAPCSFFCFAFS